MGERAVPTLELVGWGMFSGPCARTTPFPQSTSGSSMASLLIQFLTARSNEDGSEVNSVIILFYRQLTATFLAEKPCWEDCS